MVCVCVPVRVRVRPRVCVCVSACRSTLGEVLQQEKSSELQHKRGSSCGAAVAVAVALAVVGGP